MSFHTDKPSTISAPKRRAADVAYDAIEVLISTLEMQPGSPVVEAEIAERTGLGRTPVREALLRMVSIGLIEQQRAAGCWCRTSTWPTIWTSSRPGACLNA